jgi:hypothetical protein
MSDIQPLSWPEGCPSGGPVRRLACRRAADSSALGARRRTPTTTWRLRPVAFLPASKPRTAPGAGDLQSGCR